MNLNNLSRHVRLIIRGELLTVQAKLAFAMRRTLFAGLALLFAGLGLVFVNMGLFAFLTPLWGPVWTPMGLGLINIALALAVLAVAAVMKPGPELALAEEMRNLAGESLEAEFRSASPGGALGLGARPRGTCRASHSRSQGHHCRTCAAEGGEGLSACVSTCRHARLQTPSPSAVSCDYIAVYRSRAEACASLDGRSRGRRPQAGVSLHFDHWLSRLPRKDWLGWSICLGVIVIAVVLRLPFR